MPINWQEIITTFVATVGGGGVLLGAAAWLVKEVISNRLALDADKLKIEIKAKADTEIERIKADLTFITCARTSTGHPCKAISSSSGSASIVPERDARRAL